MGDSCLESARQFLTDQEITELLEVWVRLREKLSQEDAFQRLNEMVASGN